MLQINYLWRSEAWRKKNGIADSHQRFNNAITIVKKKWNSQIITQLIEKSHFFLHQKVVYILEIFLLRWTQFAFLYNIVAYSQCRFAYFHVGWCLSQKMQLENKDCTKYWRKIGLLIAFLSIISGLT